MDPLFQVRVIAKTPDPQRLVYRAMHQDYSEGFVADEPVPSEQRCGEIAVKRLLNGSKGHYGCYSSDTEVLSSTGWVPWPQVTPETELLAVDITKKECHFEKPTSLQVVPLAEGDKLYYLWGTFLNFAVTLDHRMVVSHLTKTGFSEWYFAKASEVLGKPVRYLLNSCLRSSDRALPEDMPNNVDPLTALKVAGFFFGDGLRSENLSPRSIRFKLRRPRKIAYLLSLGLPTASRKGERYVIENPDLASWVHRNFSSSKGKQIPSWVLKLPEEAVAALWDGLKNSDGTLVKEKSWALDSVYRESLDLIQATAHINGFSANLYLNNPNEGPGHENHRPCWRLSISEHATRRVETCHKGRSKGISEELKSYSGNVYCATVSTGALLVRREGKVIISGNCIEHPQISFATAGFPHSVMQQARTHRVGISFDTQSMRYTGKRVVEIVQGQQNVEEIFYLRPVGDYRDRQGKRYHYSAEQRQRDLDWCLEAAKRYAADLEAGWSEEHARGKLPFDFRQNFVISLNARSFMHFLDLRSKKDAQLEIQQLCELMWPHFEAWVPEIAAWYKAERLGKGRLAP